MTNPTTHAEAGTNYFAALKDEQFIVLTTLRASGVGVPTTVWFAEANGKLYSTTNEQAKKVGRIRANPQVTVTPSDRVGNTHGAALPATARMLAPAEYSVAQTALAAKYGEQYHAVTAQRDTDMGHSTRVFIEISAPAQT